MIRLILGTPAPAHSCSGLNYHSTSYPDSACLNYSRERHATGMTQHANMKSLKCLLMLAKGCKHKGL